MSKIFLNLDGTGRGGPQVWSGRFAPLLAERGYTVTHRLKDDWRAALFVNQSDGLEAALQRGQTVGYRVAGGYLRGWFAATGRAMKPVHHAANAAIARALDRSDAVIYQSQWAKDQLDALLYRRAERFAIISNGVDLKRFHPPASTPPGPPVIGTAGLLRYRYRLQTFFEMSRRLPFEHRLLVVGSLDEECAQELRRAQADPLLAARLTYHEHLPPDELPALYAQMSLLVHPVSGDVCPNVVIEALACGVPAVVPQHGGSAEVVGPAGVIFENRPWVYDADFCERMAQAAANALENRAALSVLARSRAEEQFDIQRMADAYLDQLGLPRQVEGQAGSAPAPTRPSLRGRIAPLVARPRYWSALGLRKAQTWQRRLFPPPPNPRLRIAFTLFDFHVGGIENWLYRLALELRGEFDFHFLATRVPEFLPKFREVGACAFTPNPASLIAYLQKQRIDLVQVHNERWPVDAALAAGVPRIVERLGGQRSWRRVPKYGIDLIIASAQMAVEAVADLAPPEKVRLVYNGIDLDAVDAAAPLRLFSGDALIVGRTSRFGKGQNLGLLIDALDRLRDALPELRLVLVGGDSSLPGAEPVEAGLRARVAALGLAQPERVRFTGLVEDSLPYVRGFDIGTCVSNDEGLPNSLIEAMACGVPVISTRVGAVTELVQDGVNGLLIPPGDLDALCACLTRLARDPDLRARLGQAGRRTVAERFSLKASAAQYAAIYRELLEGGA